MLALILTFVVGVLVGLVARFLKWATVAAIFLSHAVAWFTLVLIAAVDILHNVPPNRGLLGSAAFVVFLSFLLSIPACAGCAIALVGRAPTALDRSNRTRFSKR